MPPMTTMYGQSPHSSSGVVGSSEGTPDTRFTAFSPEDVRPLKAANEQTGTPLRASQQDPFVTASTKGKGEQKLSATASAFKPFAVNVASTSTLNFGQSATAALPGQVQKLQTLMNQINTGRGSTPGNATQSGPVNGAQQGNTNQACTFGTFSTDTGATRCIQITSIYKIDSSVYEFVINSLEAFKKSGFKLNGTERIEHGTAAVYLRYSNISDADNVYTALKLGLPKYAVEYISPDAFASGVHTPSKGSYSAHEGQVVLNASYPIGTPYNKKAFEDGLIAVLSVEGKLHAWQKQAATEAGTFRMIVEFCDSALALRAVQRLNRKQIKFAHGDVVLMLEQHTPDIPHPSHRLGHMTTPTRRSTEQSSLGDAFGRMSVGPIPSFPGQPEVFASGVTSSSGLPYVASNTPAFGLPPNPLPFMMGGVYAPGPITFPQGYSSGMHHQGHIGDGDFNPFTSTGFSHNNLTIVPNGFDHGFKQLGFQQHHYGQGFGHPNSLAHQRDENFFNRPSIRRQNAVKVPHRGRQYPNSAAGHHNHVDVHRIKQGIDVRTTVMLRNIPNKVDQAMLKEIVDESSFGRYDFMYLRIDFSNNCNVGYAFINFTDPLDIIDFVNARSNQKWYMFKSDKVAEVSYATIQGRDCLIQKFRNSSVMLEPPHYRPKLFFTIHDRTGRVGEEDEFPTSDNASKLKRSCENAEHVGLFAPSAGQHLRDEQRRRRSQFDRGTSLAEREEYGYNDGSMQSRYIGYPPY